VSFESRCLVWDRARRDRPHRDSALALAALLPLPLLCIKRRSRCVDETIFAARVELRGSFAPTRTRLANGSDDDAAILRVELDITREPRLLEERLGDADTPGVADGDDAGFDGGGAGHGNNNVAT